MRKQLAVIILVFASIYGVCQVGSNQQLADTTYTLIDSINGNKFHIQIKQELVEIKTPLSKYENIFIEYVISPKGDTLYKQISKSEMHGSIAKTIIEYREIRESNGTYRVIEYIRPKKYLIKKYNSSGKMISKDKVEYLNPFTWGANQFRSQ